MECWQRNPSGALPLYASPLLSSSALAWFCSMRIVVTTESDAIYNLEIDSQMAIEDLKALLETEVNNCEI